MGAAQSASASPLGDAQLVSGNAFMTNGVVEVGARPNGSFGSDVSAPSSYHPRTNNGQTLGFRSDRGRDGWGTGVDDGDFFTPGNPYEGFALQVGGGTTNFHLNSNRSSGLTGSYTATSNDATGQSFTWKTSAPVNGLDLTQVASVEPNGQYLMVAVTLTNTTSTAINDIYYARSVDPDNCVTNTGQSCYGSYATTNTVVSQQSGGVGKAAVSATAADGSYIDLRTSAADSVAARGFGCNSNLSLLWTSTPCGSVAVDSTDTSDSWIGLGVRTASLASGASRTFRLAYVLSSADAGAIDAAAPPTLPGASLPSGYADESYAGSVGAVEGGTPITYSVDSGTLPDGLTLDPATGKITGTPTSSGDTTFTVKAVNAKGSDTRVYTISLGAARVTPTLPTPVAYTPVYLEESYAGSVAVTAGTAPVTYSTDGGLLPPGLTLDAATGDITGTPTTEGDYSVNIKAANAKGSDTKTYVFHVGAVRTVPTLPSTDPANGWVGETYSTSVAVTAGSVPVVYSAESGDLPTGLTLDPDTGVISGEPATAGTFTFTIKADNGKGSDTHSYTIVVDAVRYAPILSSAKPGTAVTGKPYTFSTAGGGTKPVTYTITGGTLPAGLTLDPATGTITGTSSMAGTFGFTVTAANAKSSTSRKYTLTVIPAVTAPGASKVKADRADGALKLNVRTPADDGGSPVTGYQYSLDGGRTWHTLHVAKGKGTISGLKNGKKYAVLVRALNKAGAGKVSTVSGTPGWFTDPISAGKRAKLIKAPADPRSYRGKIHTTKAASTNAAGAAAVGVDKVRGRHLSDGQAVLIGGAQMFKFDSAKLTPRARAALRSLVTSLRSVKAMTCEGYADYGVNKKQELTLSKQRAIAVCGYLTKHGVKITKKIKAYGSSRPVVVGGQPSDRAANRRVVITVTK